MSQPKQIALNNPEVTRIRKKLGLPGTPDDYNTGPGIDYRVLQNGVCAMRSDEISPDERRAETREAYDALSKN